MVLALLGLNCGTQWKALAGHQEQILGFSLQGIFPFALQAISSLLLGLRSGFRGFDGVAL